MHWIQGERFITLANYIYAPERGYKDNDNDAINNFPATDYRYLKNTLDIGSLFDGDIIYTHTFYAAQLFDELKNFKRRVKLITHNCDINVNFSPPDCVTRWYSQNVNIEHERIESIPIGLENSRWFPELRKRDKMLQKLSERKQYRNLVYMNFNIKTNPSKRTILYNLLKNKTWITAVQGVNGMKFDSYIDNIYSHKFVICPEGNGMDTHRTWESLYMGAIPVEKRNLNNRFYTDLPILFVDDWEEITEPFLLSHLNRIENSTWNMEKLNFNYWKNRIHGV
jgi:hypothetical protein